MFSPINAEAEEEAAAVLAAELPDAAISLSHEIGRIGLLERENATIMNACLRGLAAQIVAAFHAALAELRIDAPVYLSQNYGTLMAAVAAGFAEIGDPARVAGVDAAAALARIEERLAETVDRMKTSADPIPVVVVGGGSILLRDALPGGE